jgi:hypothetical protein
MKQHIAQFFKFLEKKEDRQIPLKIKLLNPKDYKIDPEDLNIKGDLDLANTRIESLPDNLKVGEWLVLNNTAIDSIPNNLKVEGDLFLIKTPLAKKYTKEQIRSMIEDKGGYVKGNIVARAF